MYQGDVNGLLGERLVVGPGATLALLVTPQAGQVSQTLKYFSGGSAEIVQAGAGLTATGTTLVNLAGTGYLLGTTEAINISGPARYYIIATGSTTTLMSLRGLSAGF